MGVPTFDKEIRKRHLNATVIAHMLIPILVSNNIHDLDGIDLKKIIKSISQFHTISDNLRHVGAFDKKIYDTNFKNAIDDYDLAGFISFKDRRNPTIEMSEYQATNEIKRYRRAYGNYSVGDLDYYVKEKIVKKV